MSIARPAPMLQSPWRPRLKTGLLSVLLAAFVATLSGCRHPSDAANVRLSTATHGVSSSHVAVAATRIDGIQIEELSGLAWDHDAARLYAVSDQGDLFAFAITLRQGSLTAVNPLYARAISDPKQLSGHHKFNAEGLALVNANNGRAGDTQLLVSLEGGAAPTIIEISQQGLVTATRPVPAPLNDYANYHRKKRGLEALAVDAHFGILTAAEQPLRHQTADHLVRSSQRHWAFKRFATDDRLKGLDSLPGGRLLALERAEIAPPNATNNDQPADNAKTTSVRLLNLNDCDRDCRPRTLAVLLAGNNNFEGITHLTDRQLLLVSDQGGKDAHNTLFYLLTLTAPLSKETVQ